MYQKPKYEYQCSYFSFSFQSFARPLFIDIIVNLFTITAILALVYLLFKVHMNKTTVLIEQKPPLRERRFVYFISLNAAFSVDAQSFQIR
ncbi:hypothetical protein SB767_30225, partial [Bacillus sp. SIMBA_069]